MACPTSGPFIVDTINLSSKCSRLKDLNDEKSKAALHHIGLRVSNLGFDRNSRFTLGLQLDNDNLQIQNNSQSLHRRSTISTTILLLT